MFYLCDLAQPETYLDATRPYDVIVADPPWLYADQRKVRKDGKTPTRGIGACHHYDQLKTDEIAAIEFAKHTDRCHLFLWATCPLLPDAMHVLKAWGFRYSTVAFVWIKTNSERWKEAQEIASQKHLWTPDSLFVEILLNGLCFFGPGHHTASNVELVLLGIKGKYMPPAEGHKASQLIFAPPDEHSRKPEKVQDAIEWMYPYIHEKAELFARRERIGWDCYGNENIFDPSP